MVNDTNHNLFGGDKASYKVRKQGMGWALTKPSTMMNMGQTYATKDKAVKAGKRSAKSNRPAELVIERADGSVEDTFQYD